MSLEFARSLVFPQAVILAITYLAPDRAKLDAIGLSVLFAVRGKFIQSLENQFEFVRVASIFLELRQISVGMSKLKFPSR